MSEQNQAVKSAFEKLNLDINIKAINPEIPERFAIVLEKVYQTLVVSEALRDGHVPNYNDINEDKFEAWHYLRRDSTNPSGFRFHGSGYSNSGALSVLGPLLSQNSRDKSNEFGRIQEEIFADLYKNKK